MILQSKLILEAREGSARQKGMRSIFSVETKTVLKVKLFDTVFANALMPYCPNANEVDKRLATVKAKMVPSQVY